MRKILDAALAVAAFLLSLFFVFITAYLVDLHVMPAVRKGSLSVDTSTMILNRVWHGNEIYIILAAYVVLAGIFAYVGVKRLRALHR
jgi:hypothetical protein